MVNIPIIYRVSYIPGRISSNHQQYLSVFWGRQIPSHPSNTHRAPPTWLPFPPFLNSLVHHRPPESPGTKIFSRRMRKIDGCSQVIHPQHDALEKSCWGPLLLNEMTPIDFFYKSHGCRRTSDWNPLWQGLCGILWNGIEGLALGEKRFAKLRRSAANLLLGSHRQASPWISCHFLQ